MAWLTGWDYRKKITIGVASGIDAGTNYQVKLLIGESNFSGSTADFHIENKSANFPSAKDDGGDLRFTSSDEETLLDFWVEEVSGTTPNRIATIWVEIAEQLNQDRDIYIYYGNDTSGLANYSNGENTFNFFDDFEGTSLDGQWTELGSVTVSNSEVNLTDDDAIYGDTLFGFGYEARSRAKANEQDTTFVGFRNNPYDGNLQAIINSDHPYSNDFDRFKCGLFKGGGADPDFYIDGWYDFRNTYYQYFTKRLASDKIIWGQADNSHTYTNATYIPTNDLAPHLGVWDNTQESTLTVDWIFVRKVIETEPTFNSVEEEESIPLIELEVSDTITLSDGLTTNVSLEKEELADTVNLSEAIEINLSLLKELLSDSVNLSDGIYIYAGKNIYLDDTINLSEDGEANVPQYNVNQEENIIISDNIYPNIPLDDAVISDTITISDSINVGTTVGFATKVEHYNSPVLYIVANEDPAILIEADISTGTPSFTQYPFNASGETAKNAKDLAVNDTFDYIYVACADGQVMKIKLSDLNDRQQIDLSDTDDLQKIDCADNIYKTFTSTENTSAELYEIDEATMSIIDTDLRLRFLNTKVFDTAFHYIQGKTIDTDFRYLATSRNQIRTDFRYTLEDYDALTTIKREDFVVKIDGTSLTDVNLSSIIIRWVAEDKSTAKFDLAREHDRLNYTIGGSYSQITTNNTVTIYIQGREVFTGKIETLDCSGGSEQVTVNCVGAERHHNYIDVNLALPSLNETRHPYHIINADVNIVNPVTDYDDEDNPSFYRGIEVDLGTEEEEVISRWYVITDGSEESFEDFYFKQNWTYFFTATVYNWITGRRITDRYLGTSAGGLSDDLWEIDAIYWRKQRIYDNIERELGSYYLGTTPYKKISSKKGNYIAKKKWEDRGSGLYSVLGKHWEYENYAKEVADIEYEKLKNCNGDIAPRTEATINLTIDGFLYYNLGILTKINITNTTETDVYKNNNGFPLRIKTLIINSSNMITSLSVNNEKTEAELEELDNMIYEAEPEVVEETAIRLLRKFDPNGNEEVW